jgi:hypothetical protein
MSANGGVSNGVCHACNSGLACGREMVVVSLVSDISIPAHVADYGRRYITRWGFFGPFALDSGGLFGEIAP